MNIRISDDRLSKNIFGDPPDMIRERRKFSSMVSPRTSPRSTGTTGYSSLSSTYEASEKKTAMNTSVMEEFTQNEPAKQKTTIKGVNICMGTRTTLAKTDVRKRPCTYMKMLMKIMPIRIAYTVAPWSRKSVGPGVRLFIIRAPRRTATHASPGMPRVNRGIRVAPVTALFDGALSELLRVF